MRNKTDIRGFTLLEIMVVVIVISILATVGFPSFKNLYYKSELKTAARDLITTIRLARSLAVFTGDIVELRIDVDNVRYRLEVHKKDEDKDDDRRHRREHKTQAHEGIRHLPGDVWFVEIESEYGDAGANIVSTFFYPDGTASYTSILLENVREKQAFIEVFQNTAMARLTMDLESN